MKREEATVQAILSRLNGSYPETTALEYKNPFELLVATILSAQSTDKQVNRTTRSLFNEYSTPEKFLELSPEKLADMIRGVGLNRTKSRYILGTCAELVQNHEGRVPESREELMKLPGVGRKTANVVLSCAFKRDAMAVDTHVHRVANRLGLVDSERPEATEEALRRLIPREYWSRLHHWLIYHGRRVCRARDPQCENCMLRDLCPHS